MPRYFLNFITMFNTIFNSKSKVLIGMIHLPPLLSYPSFPGMDACIKKALYDLHALEQAGFDGVLLENDNDQPHTEFANQAQISSFAVIAREVCKNASIPVGVQMMLNDWKSTFAIATSVDAKFCRLDVFVDDVSSQWGEIHPDPEKIMLEKKKIAPNIAIFTDIQVKHKTMLIKKSLEQSASEALDYGVDAVIVTGDATGQETPMEKILRVKKAFPKSIVLVGAGVNSDNIVDQLSVADGAIVGTSIKIGTCIDLEKATNLVVVAKEAGIFKVV